MANGTNRLSVVALGLVGILSFYRRGLVDWWKGRCIAVLVGVGTIVGSLVAVELGEAVLDGVVIASLLLVLGLLLVEPGRWLRGRGGTLRSFGPGQAAAYFVIGVYAGLVVLGSGFFLLAALVFLTGCDLRHGNAMKAFVLLVVGLQSLLIFGEARRSIGSRGYRWRLAAPPGRTRPRCWPPRTGPGYGYTAFSCSWSSWR